ncbi:hypothetical protein BDV38DRAFT_181889 [Aspergillus pseudotamarii]|uniref:Uncharacterized protein n=1 Tax=Aspergillus pseudotamarii TaxID=132259 RepID=A0A5N6SG96_ASPPS|nr:uncharacterized protein BDV38DRAFT_181889 [Aspergillus pseudotamarii]KAE8133655.1 hypothetical protein BDV38DRAFT_181889 [Aspergillus pseudotamarii]
MLVWIPHRPCVFSSTSPKFGSLDPEKSLRPWGTSEFPHKVCMNLHSTFYLHLCYPFRLGIHPPLCPGCITGDVVRSILLETMPFRRPLAIYLETEAIIMVTIMKLPMRPYWLVLRWALGSQNPKCNFSMSKEKCPVQLTQIRDLNRPDTTWQPTKSEEMQLVAQ